jgi:hypothetical protein
MAGYVNSWIEQYTGVNPTPCITETVNPPTATPWLLYLIAGLVFGSLKFEKNGTHQQ